MATYNYQGDIESVNIQQLEYIGKVLQKRGFKGTDVLIQTVGEAGDNYVANVKRVVINENGTTLKMIAKLAPDNPIMREIGNLGMLFHNEHILYTDLLPKFRELQRSAGVPEEQWFRFAKCYGSSNEAPYEVILLEDLKEDNFIMLDRFQPLSNDCVKVVLKNMAIYHSLSYVLKNKEPETFSANTSKLGNMFTIEMAKRDEYKLFFKQQEDSALEILQDDKYKKNIEGTVCNTIQLATEAYETDAGSKYSVIVQGDAWTNNILFQMKNGAPINCCLIDYQLARESSPVFDIMYMLFNSTNHEQRQKHYYEFIDYYHSELDKSLHNYGLKAEFIYPREQLDADLKRYAKYMLATSVMLASFIIRKTEEASKWKESTQNMSLDNIEESMKGMVLQDKETLVLFKERVESFVDSFQEFGLL